MSNYRNLKVVELKDIARSRGLRGWSRLRKAELIAFITSAEQRQRGEEELERQQQQREIEEEQQEKERMGKAKAERKAKSKARRQAKREESKREAERRAEVKRIELNKRRQRQENIAGEDRSEKRLSLNVNKDNDWKSKRNKQRLNVEPTRKLRKGTQRRHERKRSESTEPRKKKLKESLVNYSKDDS